MCVGEKNISITLEQLTLRKCQLHLLTSNCVFEMAFSQIRNKFENKLLYNVKLNNPCLNLAGIKLHGMNTAS